VAGYTNEEIESAVAYFVQSTLRIEKSPLGPVDAESKFSEVVSLISSSLIYDSNAIFYLIFLTSNRLNTIINSAITYIVDIKTAIQEMTGKTKDITHTTLLGDAAAALLTVDQILTDKKVISNQAYNRYTSSIDQFSTEILAPNIKSGGLIVRPPQLAKQDIRVNLPLLSSLYKSILVDLQQFKIILQDFSLLNLPVLTIQNSVKKIRRDLQVLKSYFDSSDYSRDDKIAKCREAYLRITSGRSILDNYSTVLDPISPRLLSSSSIIGHLDVPISSGCIVPAEVTGERSAAWSIILGANDQLIIAEDGNSPTTYTITSPSQPSVRCYAASPYVIPSGARLEFDSNLEPVVLTTGSSVTASTIVSDINTWATTYSCPYTAVTLVEGSKTYIKITKTQTGIQQIVLTADNYTYRDNIISTYSILGFYEDQQDSNAGVSVEELVEEINAVGKINAYVSRVFFEEGKTGNIDSVVTIQLPLNSLTSLLHENDQILIRGGMNDGYHRILSVTRISPYYDRVKVTYDSHFSSELSNQNWIVLRNVLKLQSKLSTLSSKIEILNASANTEIGLSTGNYYSTTNAFRATNFGTPVNFDQYDIVVGDILYIFDGVSAETEHVITDIEDSNSLLIFSPPLPTITAIQSFRILSISSVEYKKLDVSLIDWEDWRRSTIDYLVFLDSTLELDRVINPLLSNKNPSYGQCLQAQTKLQNLYEILINLSNILVNFEIASVSRIDSGLKMLKERGLDRAYDLLMRGSLFEFFNMDKDDAASSSYMLKSVRQIVQKDLPLSKSNLGDDTVNVATIKGTDASLDYSDRDLDEGLQLLGEVPDFDNPKDAIAVGKMRF
jgi:hypothetical protein